MNKFMTRLNQSESAPVEQDASSPRAPSSRAHGQLLTDSALASTHIVGEYLGKSGDAAAVFSALQAQAASIHAGDMTQVEAILINQAVALQSIFMDLAVRAKKQDSIAGLQCLTQLALKAQASCRATLQTLAEVKNPRQVAFFKQTNVAQNQQVNNNGAAQHSRRRKVENLPNELLVEESHGGEEVVGRTTAKASRIDQSVGAVGAIHRAKDRHR